MRRSIPLSLSALGALAALAAPAFAATGPLRMFVTEQVGTGKLGGVGGWPQAGEGLTGIAAGNSICAALAQTAGIDNAGAFRAWLSDGTTDAACNVAGFSGKIADDCGQGALPAGGPWVRMDGRPFAFSLAELTDQQAVLYVQHLDQDGDLMPSDSTGVWTGLASVDPLFNCAGWTAGTNGGTGGYSGDLDRGASHWVLASGFGCGATLHLYCFESGTGEALPRFGEPGAWVFVTSVLDGPVLGTWDDANGETGIAAGDEICRTAARNGRLPAPDSYVAWLSNDDTGTDAIDRLTIDGPWRRPDGVRIADSKADLLLARHLSSISVDEFGNHVANYVYTGTGADGLATGDDCGGWQDALALSGTVGSDSSAGLEWTDGSLASCGSFDARLYCFSNQLVLFADGFERHGTFEWAVGP